MSVRIHPSWQSVLVSEFEKPYWESLTSFVKSEYATNRCFPEGKNIFRAFDLTPFDDVKVVILGQDPYHTAYQADISSSRGTKRSSNFGNLDGHVESHGDSDSPRNDGAEQPVCAAMGLSFSVPTGSKPQPSLRNIFKELESDIGVHREQTDLTDWAEQGVLLLNAVLTVREASPASHGGKGWEQFTDSVIRLLSEKKEGLVFILWGNFAISKKTLIDTSRHHIITSPHPSPFSAHNGFFGSQPFSKTNTYLREEKKQEIVWG